MRGVNKVIIIGNLGADPDVKQFQNGGSVTTISVATSEQWNDKQTGERREATEWHRISLYNKLGEIAAQYLRKGSSVYIEGSLRSRKYQDQNGQDRYITEIRADQMQMLGGSGNANPTVYSNPLNNQPFGQNNSNGFQSPATNGNFQNNNMAGNGGYGGYNTPNQTNQPFQPNQPAQMNHQAAGFDQNQFGGGGNQPQANNQPTQNPQMSTPKPGAVDDDIPF